MVGYRCESFHTRACQTTGRIMKPDEETVREVGPIWRELYGGLWHTTHPERFAGILDSGAILCEPKDIPDTDRWGTSRGPKHYPYVRFIGGVSLFDFHEFNAESYELEYPFSNWREFVPYRRAWGGAVWIEIDREQAAPSFLSGSDLQTKWKSGGNLRQNLMPSIEAAYLGPLPIAAFKRALFISGEEGRFQELEIPGFSRSEYEVLLNGWHEDGKNK